MAPNPSVLPGHCPRQPRATRIQTLGGGPASPSRQCNGTAAKCSAAGTGHCNQGKRALRDVLFPLTCSTAEAADQAYQALQDVAWQEEGGRPHWVQANFYKQTPPWRRAVCRTGPAPMHCHAEHCHAEHCRASVARAVHHITGRYHTCIALQVTLCWQWAWSCAFAAWQWHSHGPPANLMHTYSHATFLLTRSIPCKGVSHQLSRNGASVQ